MTATDGDTYKRRGDHATDMHALALSGPDSRALRDRLVSGLAERGPIAIVERTDRVDPTPTGTASVLRVDDTGRSVTTTEAGDLDTVLESLAADHGVALVIGFDSIDLPRVTVGEDPDALVAAPTVEAIDPEVVDAALDDIEPIETLESLVARVKAAPGNDQAGAIATFTGRVRARDAPEDIETTALEFEKYEGVADERLASLEAELSARDGVHEVVLHHKTGVVAAGEDIVFVVVLAGHREEAFRTVEDGINRLKAEVPLFKKEMTVEEAFWVHEQS